MRRQAKAPSARSNQRQAKGLGRLGVASLCLLTLLAFYGSSAPSSLAAPKGVVGYFGTPSGDGSLGGEFDTPRDVAVNRSGAGPADAGDIYVIDDSNHRVQRFDEDGEFVSAWGANVLTAPVNEVQTLTVAATAATYTLTFEGATTANIAFNATNTAVDTALGALPTIGGAANVTVTGGPGNASGTAPYTIAFTSGLSATEVPQLTANTGSLTGTATPATATQGSGAYEICTVAANCRAGAGTGGANTTDNAKNGSLDNPQSIAIDEDTGNVYVSDRDSRRISVYEGNGAFIRSFGFAVDASVAGETYEVCPAANRCKFGIGGTGLGQYSTGTTSGAYAIAISPPDANPATGKVFLANTGSQRVTTYDLDGANPASFGTSSNFGTTQPRKITVDSRGIVYASNSNGGGQIERYDSLAANGPVGFLAPILASINETQTATFTTFANGDTFTLGNLPAACDNATTAPIVFSSTASTRRDNIDNALEAACSGAPPQSGAATEGGDFLVSTATAPVITFQGQLGATNVALLSCAKLTGAGSCSVGAGVNGQAGVLLPGSPETATSGLAVDPDSDGAGPDEDILHVLRDPSSGSTRVQQLGPINDPGLAAAPTAADDTHGADAGFTTVNGFGSNDATGQLYVTATNAPTGVEAGHRVYVLDTPLADPSATFQSVSGISANGATVSGFVNPNGPAFPYGLTTKYHFAFKRSSDPSFTDKLPVLGNDLGRGTTNQLVSVKLPGLEAGTSYDVKLVAERPLGAGFAETGVFSFSTTAVPAEVGIPSATTAATEEGDVRAALWGSVDPNAKATTYRFEYGTTTSYGTKVPPSEEPVGSGSQDVPVAQFLEGLQPNTTYHFRIVAKNVNGTGASADRTFTTPPLGSALPENRGAELVSPADKGSSGSVAQYPAIYKQVHNQAAEGGGAIVYPLQNGIPESTVGGWTRWRAARSESGWLSAQISAPSLIKPPRIDGLAFALPSRVLYASADTLCAVLQTYNPLTADTPQLSVELGVENLYRWSADGGYELLTTRVPLNPNGVSFNSPLYPQIEAADDCSRVYFKSQYELTPGASGLYEWEEGGALRDAGLLPSDKVGANLGGAAGSAVMGGEAIAGGSGTARWNAVTPEGSLFFTAIADEGPSSGKAAIFMRENGGAAITEISRSQTAVPTSGARFEAASADGGKVFFRANYGIGPSGSGGPTAEACGPRSAETTSQSNIPIEQKPCDLYAYDVGTGELTDLSADANPADPEGAQIQGTVAIDEDGSHVYFAALGQLVPGEGRTYAQNVAGEGSANVYLAQDGELAYVATVDRGTSVNGDLLGGGGSVGGRGVLMRRANKWSAETTADGGKLLFESSRNLTGYDSNGPEPDNLNRKAVYLYSAATDGIACVSCQLDGAPTLVSGRGMTEPIAVGGSAPFLLGPARDADLTHRPRSMSEDGSRVFFTSPDALAPGAVEGKRNVYEWTNGQVYFLAVAQNSGGSGLGEYLDASASGDDVFIATREQLAPQDRDFVADVYDFRVNGGFPEAPPPPECQVDESVPLVPNQIYCQGDPAQQPSSPSPAGAGFQGPGNPPPPESTPVRKTCSKGKVKRRGKCVKRPKRAAKRAKADRAANTNRGGAA